MLDVYGDLTWNSHIHEICSKALRRLDILSCFRFKLSRHALEIMYFSFIRPILEYGNVLLTNCGSANTDKMEKVQIQTARIVTGALQCTNTQRLYKETKWQTLKLESFLRKNILAVYFFAKLGYTF